MACVAVIAKCLSAKGHFEDALQQVPAQYPKANATRRDFGPTPNRTLNWPTWHRLSAFVLAHGQGTCLTAWEPFYPYFVRTDKKHPGFS